MPGPQSRSSIPSLSGEPSLRRLGVGNGGGGDRPVRAQIVVAFVVALTLVAVPLYLMRRPASTTDTPPDAGAPGAASAAASSGPPETEAGKTPERVRLGPPQRVRCGAGPRGGHEGSLCDQLPFFEEALAKAIRDMPQCAPQVQKAGSINYVLTIDFQNRALHVFPGASGDFRGPQARRAAACVKQALERPDWSTLRHQYRHYTIAILATHLPESATALPGGRPRFD